jgi:hypothetical protein
MPEPGRVYLENGQPVHLPIWPNEKWKDPPPSRWPMPLITSRRGPRNVLIQRADGSRVVRPFRGLRRTDV